MASSIGPRGRHVGIIERQAVLNLGFGSAPRSIFPVAVSGKVSRNTKAAGIMKLGKRAAEIGPQLVNRWRRPRATHNISDEVGVIILHPGRWVTNT